MKRASERIHGEGTNKIFTDRASYAHFYDLEDMKEG